MTIQAKRSVTIEDVAAAAGVSRAAVSKVIRDAYGVSPDMRSRVEAAIERLGYRPRVSARGMRGSTYTLGFEIPSIHNHFFPKIITGAMTALAETRYQLIIAPAGPDHDEGPQAIEVLADRQVDGIVAISSKVPPSWLENLARSIPLVMIGRHHASVHYDTLVGDDVLGAGLAVMYGLWIMIVATAFWVVRMDNLIYLLSSVFDAARWPASVFRGVWKVVFTFVIPLALMTTFPARALLGTVTWQAGIGCLVGALLVSIVARLVWRLALRSYTSASS